MAKKRKRKYRRRNKIRISPKIWSLMLIPIILLALLVLLIMKDNEEIGKEEKKPNYLYCDKKINYRRKGKITKEEQRYLKRLVELTIEKKT